MKHRNLEMQACESRAKVLETRVTPPTPATITLGPATDICERIPTNNVYCYRWEINWNI